MDFIIYLSLYAYIRYFLLYLLINRMKTRYRDSTRSQLFQIFQILAVFVDYRYQSSKFDEFRGLLINSRKIPIFLENYEIFSVSDIREFFAKRKI